ncbi:MAG: arylesterase [Gammaproteobacteria bacterium]|nr:arylesterase [Gammaproteobacteria bacterium]
MRILSCIVCALFLSIVGAGHAAGGTVLVVGDSLSAAYGIEKQLGWVALLEGRLRARGLPFRVANASITGDTTRGGLSRLPAALDRFDPAVVVIALGGNDGLRGFAPPQTRANLRDMIRLSREAGAAVLLLGIKLPANYGKAYGDKFHRIFQDLATAEGVRVVPFFLEGVAETRELMQADGIHPDVAAQPRILDNVWSELAPMLDTRRASAELQAGNRQPASP